MSSLFTKWNQQHNKKWQEIAIIQLLNVQGICGVFLILLLKFVQFATQSRQCGCQFVYNLIWHTHTADLWGKRAIFK